MKKVIITSLIIAMVLGIGIVFATKDETGNGTRSGKHYNLNIIGVKNEKNANFNGGNGSRIFVLREGTTWFYVGASDHYEVLDHNATDGVCGGHGTAFPPGTEGTKGSPGILFPTTGSGETTQWQVDIYVRLLGPPTSEVKWKTYVFDGDKYALVKSFTIPRTKKFNLKTGDLLVDGFEDILWEMYDKKDFRLLQMRIYVDE